jgi:glutamate-1-semialdehyde 2,1-aminomutase
MAIYRSEPVIEHLHRQGDRLSRGVNQAIGRHGLQKHVEVSGRACNLLFGTRGPDGKPSQSFRTLFLQETLRRGVIMPSLVVSYSHTDQDIDRTIDAIDGALGIYAKALEGGSAAELAGRPSRTVFDRK